MPHAARLVAAVAHRPTHLTCLYASIGALPFETVRVEALKHVLLPRDSDLGQSATERISLYGAASEAEALRDRTGSAVGSVVKAADATASGMLSERVATVHIVVVGEDGSTQTTYTLDLYIAPPLTIAPLPTELQPIFSHMMHYHGRYAWHACSSAYMYA